MHSTAKKTVTHSNKDMPRRNGRQKPKSVAVNPLKLEDDLLALARTVPAREWAKLPNDLNENLDHYLYGSPKKPGRRRRAE